MVQHILSWLINQCRQPPPSNPVALSTQLRTAAKNGDLLNLCPPDRDPGPAQAYRPQQSKLIRLHEDDGA
jgi:hypothetical protein